MLKYLLDTSIVIYTIKRRSPEVRRAFKQHEGQFAISSATWGELVFGAEHSAHTENNLADIEGLASRLEILPFDHHAATHFGQIRAELYRQGKPIGPYDMVIDAHARSKVARMKCNGIRGLGRCGDRPGFR